MSNKLYYENQIIASVKDYFLPYFSNLSKPMQDNLMMLILGMYAMESFDSVRTCYRHILNRLSNKSLNTFYRSLDKCKLEPHNYIQETVKLALSIIPEFCKNQPIFLSTDDTIITKFGDCFEHVGKLRDHAMRTGLPYVNGHNFVSLMISIPIIKYEKDLTMRIRYVPIPLGYQMKTDGTTKLELVADMVDSIANLLHGNQVIFTFDSWYAKGPFIERILKHRNITIICNARIDSAIYAPPDNPNIRKKGRPAKFGKKLDAYDDGDFNFTYELDKYKISHRVVIAKIFGGRQVHAYVTKTDSDSRRLYFCSVHPSDIHMACAWQAEWDMRNVSSKDMEIYPLILYHLRWNIEVGYYNQKTFWSLGKYMVRGKKSIESFINLVNISYAAMIILPYADTTFERFKEISPQDIRMFISEKIYEQLFLANIGQKAIRLKNKTDFLECLFKLAGDLDYAA